MPFRAQLHRSQQDGAGAPVDAISLRGAMLRSNCEGCHVGAPRGNLQYVNIFDRLRVVPSAEYNATTTRAPGGRFPPTAGLCHTPITWPATSNFAFDHGRTGFPLTGAHLNVACTRCHAGGVFTGLNPACVSCHQVTTTARPIRRTWRRTSPRIAPRVTAHRLDTRRISTMTAALLPIYSGAHDNKWSGCSTCHINASNYAQFSCYAGCHEHDSPTEMADKHSGVPGYNYDSLSCYNCHPRGNH